VIPRHFCKSPEAFTTCVIAGADADPLEVAGAGLFDAGDLLGAEDG
jgi:hypothetical protein